MRLSNSCPTVTHQVVCALHKMLKPGEAVTDEKWNLAYKWVRTMAIAETCEWKFAHMTKAPKR